MKLKGLIFILALFLILAGCTIGTTHSIRLKGNADPTKISLEKRTPISIEAGVENIGNKTEIIQVRAGDDTEGISITNPERTSFTLKPGESRIVIFMVTLEEAAAPGDYRVDIIAESDRGDEVSETVFISVVTNSGII